MVVGNELEYRLTASWCKKYLFRKPVLLHTFSIAEAGGQD